MISAANVEKLKEVIALPDWETRLTPLFLFPGSKPYAIRANLNIAYGMFLEGAETPKDGFRLFDADQIHLCGKHCKHLPTGQLATQQVFGRLRLSPDVTDGISKAFTEYVEFILPRPFDLQRINIDDLDFRPGVTPWWKVQRRRGRKHNLPAPTALAYPYIRGTPTADHELLLKVHAMLPKGLPHDIRGDLCQDLIVAILSGETTVENIPDEVAKYARHAKKFLPDKWKNIPLDTPIYGTDGLTIGDTLVAPCEHDHDDEEEFSTV